MHPHLQYYSSEGCIPNIPKGNHSTALTTCHDCGWWEYTSEALEELLQLEHIVRGQYTEWCSVGRRMRMLLTLLLIALTATSGENTHTLQ